LAQKRNDKFISTNYFLLAACEEKGVLNDLLKKAGVIKKNVEIAIEKMRGGEAVDDAQC